MKKQRKRGRPIGGKAPSAVRKYWRIAKQIDRANEKVFMEVKI